MSSKPLVICLGLNHKTAPLSQRELFFLTNEQIEPHLKTIQNKFRLTELFVLSTCNRLEMYAIASECLDIESKICEAFFELQSLCGKKLELTSSDFSNYSYLFREQSAWEHLMSVVASLDSLVIGETQITGQFKDALKIAENSGSLGCILNRLCQESLAVAKKIRNQTSIGKKTVSISHAAIDLAKRVFGNLSDHHFMLIGAGEIAEVAAQYAASHNPKSISILNRSVERARLLVDQLGYGKAFGLNELATCLEQADMVITSTAAASPIITKQFLSEIMHRRRTRPLFICDIAIPRDVAIDCGEIEEVYLFELDDLKQIVKENQEERQACAIKAREIIQSGSSNFANWLKRLDSQPVLADFKAYLDLLTSSEASRTLEKQAFKDMTEEQKHAIRRMLDSIVKKLAADAARAVLMAQADHEMQLLHALKTMFPLKASDEDSSCLTNITYLP